ncbi:MAG: cell division protein, partial [Candidatus Doudnabacteria bacterium Gr01-1014_77]
LLGLISFGGLWFFGFKDYQKQRILTFLHPLSDITNTGYNAYQSTVAVGSGQWFGKGVGFGTQSRLQFLPEYQTDFIFASASEELGFVGSSVILILYFILLFRLLVIYRISRDDLSRFVVIGIFFMIFGQVVINIGMNMGILPVTGIPLPFLSYGGSSLMTVAISMGIAEAVAVNAKGLRL